MLYDKDRIVDERYLAEGKLYGISRDPGPVALAQGVNAHLSDAEDAAADVQQDLCDRPSVGRAVTRIGQDLGRVLDERDEQLHVAQRVHEVKQAPAVFGGAADALWIVVTEPAGVNQDEERHDGHAQHAAAHDTEDKGARLTRGPDEDAPRRRGASRAPTTATAAAAARRAGETRQR